MHKNPMTDEKYGNYGQTMYTTLDRRGKPRIDCDYQAIVEGFDCAGIKYRGQGRLVNLSAGGLFLFINQDIDIGSKLSVIVHLSKSPLECGCTQTGYEWNCRAHRAPNRWNMWSSYQISKLSIPIIYHFC